VSLAKQKIAFKKELALSQEENLAQAFKTNLTQTELAQKQAQLKKTRLEVVSLQFQLKKAKEANQEPDPIAPTQNKPINP
jgi:hypothetical protein